MFFRDRFLDEFSMAFFTDFGPKRLQNGPRESPPWVRRRAYGCRPPPPNGPFGAEGVPKTFFIRFAIVFGPHFEMILGTFLKKNTIKCEPFDVVFATIVPQPPASQPASQPPASQPASHSLSLFRFVLRRADRNKSNTAVAGPRLAAPKIKSCSRPT